MAGVRVAVVVNPGGDEAAWRAAEVRLAPYDLVLVRVVTPDPGDLGLADLGLDSDPPVLVTRSELARWWGHRAAWRVVVAEGEVALVMDDDAEPTAAFAAVLDALGDGDATTLVGVAGDDPPAAGYVLGPLAAAELLADGALVPELDTVVRPPAVRVVARPEPDDVVTDHLAVVEAGVARDDAAPLVLVLPEGARLVGTPADVLAGLAESGAVALRAGAASVGPPGVEATHDESSLVFADPSEPSVTVLGDGLLDVVHGTRPPVALGPFTPDPGARDLVRLLRYDDAVDDGGWVRDVGAELVAMAFWTPEFCATVVRAAEAAEAWGADPDDPVPGVEVSLATLSPRLFDHLRADLSRRAVPRLRRRWPYVEDVGLRDAFVVKVVPGGGSLRMHHDVAQFSGSIRLNEGYVGGELVFPRQGWSNASMPVGALVCWPSLVTHPHASQPVRSGVKYNLTIWWEVPGAPAR